MNLINYFKTLFERKPEVYEFYNPVLIHQDSMRGIYPDVVLAGQGSFKYNKVDLNKHLVLKFNNSENLLLIGEEELKEMNERLSLKMEGKTKSTLTLKVTTSI